MESLDEFKKKWSDVENSFGCYFGYNIIEDVVGSKIKTDRYEFNYDDNRDILVLLCYKEYCIAKVMLKDIF